MRGAGLRAALHRFATGYTSVCAALQGNLSIVE